MILWWEIHQ